MRFCVYATSTDRGPKSDGIIAGSSADDSRPVWVASGVLHGAKGRDAWTLCGLSTEGLHRFADHDFESVTISAGACRECAVAAEQSDD
jgi:hypothetical protein